MTEYNASNTRHIRRAAKEARQRESERREVISRIMGTPAGRYYFHDRLIRSHVFETSFTSDGFRTAFNEGERNIGLQDLLDIIRYCPDQYIAMMREATDREIANARRTSDSTADRREQNRGWDDSGTGDDLVSRDYEPSADDGGLTNIDNDRAD
jgi:hypothetical protein